MQLSNEHVIISYESMHTKNNLVSEISTDGSIIRSFDLTPAKPLSTAASIHMCLDNLDGVYIASNNSNEIRYFNTIGKSIKDLSMVSSIITPARLCYSSDDSYEMLFVGISTKPGVISIGFKNKNSSTRPRTCLIEERTGGGIRMTRKLFSDREPGTNIEQ